MLESSSGKSWKKIGGSACVYRIRASKQTKTSGGAKIKIKTRGEVLKVCISDSFKNFARANKSKNRCNLSLSSTLKLAVCQRTSFSTRFVITLEAVC